jgi:hypothetical protein
MMWLLLLLGSSWVLFYFHLARRMDKGGHFAT